MEMQSGLWIGPPEQPDSLRLVALLGAGGEGEVWRAVSERSGLGPEDVAVKISRASGDEASDAAWASYARTLLELRHSGLVRVRDAFFGAAKHRAGEPSAGGEFRYIVMDYVPGLSLQQWLAEHPEATFGRRRRVLRSVASALDELHAHHAATGGAAHGDVKPSNIVITPGGLALLVDLGLTKIGDSAARSGRTDAYAAPEMQDHGATATAAGDAFAFVATVAHALTGAVPPADTNGHLDVPALRARLRDSRLTKRRPRVRHRIIRALSVDPGRRPRRLRLWLDDRAARATGAAAAALVIALGTGGGIALTMDGARHQATLPRSTGAPHPSVPIAFPLTHSSSAPALRAKASPAAVVAHGPLVVGGVSWLPAGCDPLVMVAGPGSFPSLPPSVTDDRQTLDARPGAGLWHTGTLGLFLSIRGTQHVMITSIDPELVGMTAAPGWVFAPSGQAPLTPCGNGPGSNVRPGVRDYLYNADTARFTSVDQQGGPEVGDAGMDIGVLASSCAGNYRFRMAIRYRVVGDPTPRVAYSDPVTLYGHGARTTYLTGYQNDAGDLQVKSVVFSGSDPRCAPGPGIHPASLPYLPMPSRNRPVGGPPTPPTPASTSRTATPTPPTTTPTTTTSQPPSS